MQNVVLRPLLHLEEPKGRSILLKNRHFPQSRLPELLLIDDALSLLDQLNVVGAYCIDLMLLRRSLLLGDRHPVRLELSLLLVKSSH